MWFSFIVLALLGCSSSSGGSTAPEPVDTVEVVKPRPVPYITTISYSTKFDSVGFFIQFSIYDLDSSSIYVKNLSYGLYNRYGGLLAAQTTGFVIDQVIASRKFGRGSLRGTVEDIPSSFYLEYDVVKSDSSVHRERFNCMVL